MNISIVFNDFTEICETKRLAQSSKPIFDDYILCSSARLIMVLPCLMAYCTVCQAPPFSRSIQQRIRSARSTISRFRIWMAAFGFAQYREERESKAKSPAASLLAGAVLLVIALILLMVYNSVMA